MKRPFLLLVFGAACVVPVSCGGSDGEPFVSGDLPEGGSEADAGAADGSDGAIETSTPVACGMGCTDGERCDELTETCVECLFHFDCGENEQCTTGNRCEAVVSCDNSLDCRDAPGDRGICDEAEGVCVECTTTADCGTRGRCVDNACDGSTPCETADDCDEGVCDTADGICVGCLTANDCGEGERCVRNECRPTYECSSDNDCTPRDLLCDQGAGHCVTCRRNSDCPALYHCSEGDCLLDACDSGQTSCRDRSIVTCNEIGDDFADPEPCPAGTVCRVTGRNATCESVDGGAGRGDAGVPEAGACTTVFYRDADEDGYGDAAATMTACEAPEGYVANDDDCYDGNRDAKPGQMAYFAEERGDGSFDYDCADGEEPRWTGAGSCSGFPGCSANAGWIGGTPACGDSADWLTSCTGLAAICGQQTDERTQECR